MKFKPLILLAAIAFILLAGCAQPPQPDKSQQPQQTDKSILPDNKQTTVEDEEMPPAPPSDTEEEGQAIATQESDMPPLPPSEESDMPSLPLSDEEIPSIENQSTNEIPGIETQPTDEIPGPDIEAGAAKNHPKEFVGQWRAFSSRLFYDIGGGGSVGSGTGHPLEINEDGTWQFSTSAGNWSIADITSSDWGKWGVSDYGPKRKIILDNWNNAIADGPVEESDGMVDFIWVIYRVEPPEVSSPGQVQAKYGHAN